MFCLIGLYSIENDPFSVYVAALFSLVGYMFVRTHCEGAPLLLGFVLGPMLKENLRRSLLLSDGNPLIFVTRPISATFLAIAIVLIVSALVPQLRKKREVAFSQEGAEGNA